MARVLSAGRSRLLDRPLSRLSFDGFFPVIAAREEIDGGRVPLPNHFFVAWIAVAVFTEASRLTPSPAGAVSVRGMPNSGSFPKSRTPLVFTAPRVCDLTGFRLRNAAVSATADVGSSADVLTTVGARNSSFPEGAGSARSNSEALQAEEKMPPRISSSDVSKKAMSSILGKTTDSAICT